MTLNQSVSAGRSLSELLVRAAGELGGGDEGRLEAELLLACAVKASREWLHARPEWVPGAAAGRRFRRLVTLRRERRTPTAYLTGTVEFRGVAFATPPGVFVPRPETEELVAAACERLRGPVVPPGLAVFEPCCGTGAVAVSLALELRKPVVASDISPAAVEAARCNALRAGVGELVEVRLGEGLEAFRRREPGRRAAAVIANPPYVSRAAMSDLDPQIALHEPSPALDGGDDGLAVVGRLIDGALRVLAPEGLLGLEIGADQGGATRRRLVDAGYENVEILRDLSGFERMAFARAAPLRSGETVARVSP